MISVIIPVYNGEKWLKNCIDSLALQNYKDFEILLINDGSTDSSEALCEEFARQHPYIKVFHKENGGAASARNVGLNNAKGDYVAFIDADDTVEPLFLETLYTAAKGNDADIAMCDYIKHNANGSFPYSQPIRGGIYSKEQISKELFPCIIMFDNLEFPPTISNCVCLFKRSLLENFKIRYPEVRLCEDSFFGSVALYNAESFMYLKGQHLYNYMYYPSSVSHNRDKEKQAKRWASFIQLNQEYESYFENKGYDFSKQIKYNMLYFVLNQLSCINGNSLPLKEHKKAVNEVINHKRVRKLFKNFKYPKVPAKLKLYIFFIKHKMTTAYCLFHRY